jgi:hypothetical protein
MIRAYISLLPEAVAIALATGCIFLLLVGVTP